MNPTFLTISLIMLKILKYSVSFHVKSSVVFESSIVFYQKRCLSERYSKFYRKKMRIFAKNIRLIGIFISGDLANLDR